MSNVLQEQLLGYPEKSKTVVAGPASNGQLRFHSARAHNRSGGTANVGILKKFNAGRYTFAQIDVSATPDVVANTTLKAGSATTIFTTTDDDGFLVESKEKFSLIGLNIAQVETPTPVYAYQYFNGTIYTPLAALDLPTAYTSLGEQVIAFLPPADWALGTTAAVGASTDKFSILVTATTAGGQAVTADELWVGDFLAFQDTLADNGTLEYSVPTVGLTNGALLLDVGEGIMPYFGTADAGNMASVVYETHE